MSVRKTSYAEFCRTAYVPVHLQPWWLDAVCTPQHWNVCLSTDGSGRVVAALPYHTLRKAGLEMIRQPPLTSYAGPWLQYPENQGLVPRKRYDFEKKIFDELIRQLPRVFLFQQNFHPAVTNWLPFYWAGFRQTTRYTYAFDAVGDTEKLKAAFKNTLRTDLKKAGHAAEVFSHADDAALIYRLHEQSFARKNSRPPYGSDTFVRLHTVLEARGQARCFIARDRQSGAPHAGLYLAFDERRASVLLSGTDPAFKSASAVWLLFWEAIVFCAERGIGLDFEGSMDKNIGRGFRAFGAPLVPYHHVWKAQNRLADIAVRLRR